MSSRNLKIALAVSIALNVFILGLILGAVGQRVRMTELRAAPVEGNPLVRAGDFLEPDKRMAYRRRLRQEAMANQAGAEAAREARERIAQTFSSAQFDPVAANTAFAEARAAELATRERLERAVVESARDMTRDERRQLVQGLRQRGGPGRPGGGRGAGPGRGPRGGEGLPYMEGGPPPE